MNKKNVLPLVFLTLTLAAAVAVPLFRYFTYRDIALHGEKLMFRVNGFDPYDPFRGRFIRIQLEPSQMTLSAPPRKGEYVWNLDGYVEFREGPDGLAEAVRFTEEKPSGGLFIRMKDCTWSRRHDNTDHSIRLRYPVDRFYMNELLAPEAEKILADRKHRPDLRAEVRLRSGACLIREIYADGMPLAEYVRKRLAARQ